MKTKLQFLLLVLTILAGARQAVAQGTAFTYQGQLYAGTNLANGAYNLEFSLYTAQTGGTQNGATKTNLDVAVTNGLFLVTVDFGSNIFTGGTNWLQIGVATNGVTTFTNLAPRQQIKPVPYAIFATTASNVSGTLASASLSGTYTAAVTLNNAGNSFTGNGSGLTSLNASQLTSGTVPDGELSGNVALLNGNQSFTGSNSFSGLNASLSISGTGQISTSIFTGLGFQFYNSSGEGAIMSSVNDNAGLLTFYTKPGTGFPPAKQMKLDRNGVLFIDQQNANYGALNDNTTNGDGIAFGGNSGEGIASQRTAGVNQNGLDFYTAHIRQMSILNNGNVGIGTTNPSTALQVNGTVTATAFSGNGGGLTNLNANNFSSGTVPLAQLPGTVGLLSDAGSANFFAGLLAGTSVGSGYRNTGVGDGALAALTGGLENTAIGYDALNSVKAGSDNTASGAFALGNITSGSQNTAVGAAALGGNSTGNNNVAIGYEAIQNNSTGGFNIALGYQAGISLAAGSSNIDIGNSGASGDNGIIRIGTPGAQSSTYLAGNVALNGGLNIDQTGTYGANNGTVTASALNFGTGPGGSGEGIASQRTSGPNQFDLTLFTGFNPRLTVLSSGYVGIGLGTNQANSQLEVGGDVRLDNNRLLLAAANDGVFASDGLYYDVGGIGGINNNSGPFLGGYFGGALGSLNSTILNLSWDAGGNVWVNNYLSAGSLTVRGGSNPGITASGNNLIVNSGFLVVNGLTPVQAYIGDDGIANDVNIGSQKSGVTAVSFFNTADQAYMHVDVSSISIHGGSDLAEPFQMANEGRNIPQGAVVVIDEANPGQLKMTDRPYDTRVAGVVSGANGINPGIQMQQQGLLEGGRNVALSGRVYVQADTSNGAIKPGDLLTTSSTPGHAMKVTNHAKAQGAILGKAMTGLKEGQGMVLVLVTLQ